MACFFVSRLQCYMGTIRVVDCGLYNLFILTSHDILIFLEIEMYIIATAATTNEVVAAVAISCTV